MSDVDGITPRVLSRILKHVLPSYQEVDGNKNMSITYDMHQILLSRMN